MAKKPVMDPTEAQIRLDQIRHQAGGKLSGDEVAARAGRDVKDISGDPPLDFRLTPGNVIAQLIAIAIFGLVIWFFYELFSDSVSLIFGRGDPQG